MVKFASDSRDCGITVDQKLTLPELVPAHLDTVGGGRGPLVVRRREMSEVVAFASGCPSVADSKSQTQKRRKAWWEK
jgi:hypothetical protein